MEVFIVKIVAKFRIQTSTNWTQKVGETERETQLLSHQQAETTCWNNHRNCALSACWNNNHSSFKSMISSLVHPRIREAAKTHKLVEQELAHAVNATALVLTEAKLSSPEVRHRERGEERGTDGRTDGWSDWGWWSKAYRFSAIRSSPVSIYRLLILQPVNLKRINDVASRTQQAFPFSVMETQSVQY